MRIKQGKHLCLSLAKGDPLACLLNNLAGGLARLMAVGEL